MLTYTALLVYVLGTIAAFAVGIYAIVKHKPILWYWSLFFMVMCLLLLAAS